MSDQEATAIEANQEESNGYHPRETIGTHFDTSESELIVSGALLFSLFQLPKVFQSMIEFALNNFDFERNMIPLMTLIYLITMVSALQIAFIIHIGLRGFWIGVMGLFSVIPPNSGWSPEKYGAVGSRFFRDRMPGLPQLLKKSDQLASVTFSLCILLVLLLVYTTLFVVALGFIDIIVQATLPEYGKLFRKVTIGIVLSFSAFAAAVSMLDKRMGKKEEYDKDSWKVRVLEAYYRILTKFMPMNIYFPINKGLIDRFGLPKLMSATYALMGLAFVMTIVQMTTIKGTSKLADGLHPFFRAKGQQVLDYNYYEDATRLRKAKIRTPSVQSAMVETPYVRLFLPLHPSLEVDLKDLCPDAKGLNKWSSERAESEAMDQAIACIGSYFVLSLNGETLSEPDYLFFEHRERKLRGLVTFIPAESLQKGRNLLNVSAGLPDIRGDHDGDEKPRDYPIYLWC